MFGFLPKKRRVYLDYAASTPVDPRVLRSMEPYWRETFAAPGSLHEEGRSAKEALARAREKAARALNARASEIIFTSGGTESNHLAILGALKAARGAIDNPQIVMSAIEHASVRESVRALREEGVEVVEIPVDEQGLVHPEEIEAALTPRTALVTVMYVNNEIGVVEPIREVGRKVEEYRKSTHSRFPYFHTDASQAPLYFDCAPERLLADLMTIDGHKIYGPKGVGILFKKHDVEISHFFEKIGGKGGLRPGTPALPLAAGIAEALSIAVFERQEAQKKVGALRDFFISEAEKRIPGVVVNGDRKQRSPSNVHLTVPGVSSERLVYALDSRGVAAATKSACLEERGEVSYVLFAIGRKGPEGGLRFTLGKETTRAEIVYALDALEGAVLEARRIA